VHKHLDFHPYKTAVAPGLNNRDTVNRRISSEQHLTVRNSDAVVNITLMSNEAHLLLSDYVYQQNYRNWAAKNSRDLHQIPFHR
jgi:hypothetical protein